MKQLFLILYFIFFSGYVYTQNKECDSLKQLLKQSMPDTNRVIVLGKIIEMVDEFEVEKYNNLLLELLEKKITESNIDSKSNKLYHAYLASAYHNKAQALEHRMQLSEALDFYNKSILLNKKVGEVINTAYTETRVAEIYTLLGEDYSKVSKMLYKSLEIFERYNEKSGIGQIYMLIADLNARQKNIKKEKEFYEKAYHVFKEMGFDLAQVNVLSRLANLSSSLKEYKEAMSYLNKIRSLIEKMNKGDSKMIEEAFYFNMAKTCYLKGDLDSAFFYVNKSIYMLKQGDISAVLNERYLLTSNIFKQKKEYTTAITYAEMALKLSREGANIERKRQATNALFKLYKLTRNYAKALEMHEETVALSDSVEQTENKKYILEQQVKYEYEKKELLAKHKQQDEINALNLEADRKNTRKNMWLIILGVGFLILTVSIVFVVNYFKQRNTIQVQKNSLLKQKLLVSQMNPHFIFNALNAIQNYIFKESPLEAGKYLSKFAEMIRMILDFSTKDYITLEKELLFLNNYLQLQQMRFNNKFDFTFTISEDIDPNSVSVPPMLAQPFIENAIEHGLFYKSSNGHILIGIEKKENDIVYTIEDDGVGLKMAKEQKQAANKTHESMAVSITNERMETLYGKTGGENSIRLEDKSEKNPSMSGVKVSFAFPYKEV